jgi:hypothetical protein
VAARSTSAYIFIAVLSEDVAQVREEIARFIAGTIVKHMWIIFVLLPVALFIIVSLFRAAV